jgi:hypothetical protein
MASSTRRMAAPGPILADISLHEEHPLPARLAY